MLQHFTHTSQLPVRTVTSHPQLNSTRGATNRQDPFGPILCEEGDGAAVKLTLARRQRKHVAPFQLVMLNRHRLDLLPHLRIQRCFQVQFHRQSVGVDRVVVHERHCG